jgi:hypothetical protein
MTTVLVPVDLAHLVQVVAHTTSGLRAECRCGWASRWYDDHPEADAMARRHREVAVGSPTGIEAVLGGLLDLQDDLADAVMWLAEHWTAELPLPRAVPHIDQRANGDAVPGLTLLMPCASRDTVSSVADTLGADVTVERTASDRLSERTSRRFGRVWIDACYEIADDSAVG